MSGAIEPEVGIDTPLGLLAAYAARAGALVDVGDTAVEILAPPPLAAALGVRAHGRYAAVAGPDADPAWVGFGSPILERLLDVVTRDVPWSAQRWTPALPVRDSAARAAVERFVLRNAVFDLQSVVVGHAWRVAVFARYTAVADDRRDGLVDTAVALTSGAEVPHFWAALPARGELSPAAAAPAHDAVASAVTAALGRLGPLARAQSHAFFDGFARRQARDRKRIDGYFAGLDRETRKRGTRVSAADAKDRRAAIARERDAKLRELDERGRTRVDLAPVAAIAVEAPVVRLALRVRRRKAETILDLEHDAATGTLVALPCAACAAPAPAPALCDDRLHPLCTACVPDASGRWPCPACTRRVSTNRP